MRARHKRSAGGVCSSAKEGGIITPHPGIGINPHAEGRADGGKVMGKMGKMRLDRPGRKRGGAVGADKTPLSSAHKGTEPDERKEGEENESEKEDFEHEEGNKYAKGGYTGIHIKAKNEGKFTAKAKSAGKSVQGEAAAVLKNPDASPLQKKRANFARNAAKWHHGG